MKTKTLSEVLKELESLNHPVKISSQTIRRYWQWGLASKPVKIGHGQGVENEYPDDMATEVAASYRLLKDYRQPNKEVARARKLALYAIQAVNRFLAGTSPANPAGQNPIDMKVLIAFLQEDTKLLRLIMGDVLVAFLGGQWILWKIEAEKDLRLRKESDVVFDDVVGWLIVIAQFGAKFPSISRYLVDSNLAKFSKRKGD